MKEKKAATPKATGWCPLLWHFLPGNNIRPEGKEIVIIIIIINKVNSSVCFIYMNPNTQMYSLQTRHEHLGSFHSLMFCLKFTREKIFFIFAGNCWHNWCAVVSSQQCLDFSNWLSRSLGISLVYGIFLSLNISFKIVGDTPFRHLKISIISCWIFLTWMFTKSCFLKRSS